MKYINRLVEYFHTHTAKDNKDLIVKLRIWRKEFEDEAIYSDWIAHTRAKQKYILMRWDEYDSQQIQNLDEKYSEEIGENPAKLSGRSVEESVAAKDKTAGTKKSKCVKGSYENEENGMFY